MSDKTYLGDSVSVEYESDGTVVKLTTTYHNIECNQPNVIRMNRRVFEAFWAWTIDVAAKKPDDSR